MGPRKRPLSASSAELGPAAFTAKHYSKLASRATLLAAPVKVRLHTSSGLWGLRPPGASRCSARASLRTPSRPHPPRTCFPPLERQRHLYRRCRNVRLSGSRLLLSGSRATNRFGTAEGLSGRSPHHAGGGGGKERAARYERSSDWPQGGAQRSP